uniref:NADH-ubiquinone oxidoreductase chain 3 n=1 Tax=Margaritifera margaritifera TaxID=102329 RepID=S4S284_PINMG|nr:NADH dehydrogenase subunit 3 [Pinctada margaritifera]
MNMFFSCLILLSGVLLCWWHPLVYAVASSLVLGLVLLGAGSFLSKYQPIDWEKGSPYECGFDPESQAWNPVPMRFFHMVLLFLLWEVETMLLIPMMVGSWSMGKGEMGTSLFIVVLVLGLIYEWSEGTLEWLLKM